MNDDDLSRWLGSGILLEYLDGAVDAETQAQIERALERSPVLQQELSHLARLQTALDERLHTTEVSSSLALGEYVLGLLSPEEAAAVEQRLVTHPRDAQEVAELRAYLADLDLPPLDATPQNAESPTWMERLQAQVTTVVAHLVEGPAGGPALGLAGVRGAEVVNQMYQAGDVQVIVDVQGSLGQPERRDILGLVMGTPDPQTLHAGLYRQDQQVAATMVDDLGNFVLTAISPGEYGLLLHTDTLDIAISLLRVE